MTTLKRLSAYLLVFVILLSGFGATPLSHSLDYFVYRTLYLDPPGQSALTENILLIDLPYRANDSDNDPTEYRLRLADLLASDCRPRGRATSSGDPGRVVFE